MKLTPEGARQVVDTLDFKRRLSDMDLIVAIARSWTSGKVLMQAYMNREAVMRTLTTGQVTYWSTSRRQLWIKGEESGCQQRLMGFSVDCDGDSMLLDVEQKGPACHKGLDSCFDTFTMADEKALRTQLIDVIRRDALTFGDFILTSGRRSRYYLDIKKVTTCPDRLAIVSRLIASRFLGDIDVVAGPELGAIPIVVAVALTGNLPYAMIRRAERLHGTARAIEGELVEGNRVLLIDDVTTSGGSLVRCIEAVRSTGADVTRATCVVDRREGAVDLLKSKAGVDLVPLLTIEDLGLEP